jgi:putative PIN family toxin of toxin-antitoxin system
VQEKRLPRIVADTNVLVSALLGKKLRIFLEKLSEDKFELFFSEATFEELFAVLTREKFADYLSKNDIQEFRELLSYHSQLVTTTETISVCRDPKDKIFLECAMEVAVDYLVSGDQDLLVLRSYRNIPIVTPIEFLTTLD